MQKATILLNRLWHRHKVDKLRLLELKNGLTVVLHNMPYRRSATVGLWVPVGSAIENKNQEGYAHFVEHMLFKGTKRRNYSDISREIESLGGYFNAATNRETTSFYIKISGRYIKKALEVLSDVFFYSTFPKKEFLKEKEVILDEIRLAEDNPSEVIYELFYEKSFAEHSFAHSIGGSRESISTASQEKLFNFYRKNYGPKGSVLSIAGGLFNSKKEEKELEKTIRQYFEHNNHELEGEPSLQKISESNFTPGVFLYKIRKEQQQVFFILGMPALDLLADGLEELSLFTNAMGGSMSSRLFRSLREDKGLCYYIGSTFVSYYRTGVWATDGATSPAKLTKSLFLVGLELRQALKDGLHPTEVQENIQNLIGSLELSLESPHQLARFHAASLLIHKKPYSYEEQIDKYSAITRERVSNLLNRLWKGKVPTLAMLGPKIPQRELGELRSFYKEALLA
ncbi:MAG: insulinase family protein [Leptospiraceae bacterium]|nr:insulinase family protein [Leptospiraceae bacterium]MDW8307531.1 pitrilysin family protein [Leptospiraceae bacterium]